MGENGNVSSHRAVQKYLFRASAMDFRKIPGSPISYWISPSTRKAFSDGSPFRDVGFPRVGMQTSNNAKYLRLWYEIAFRGFIDFNDKSPQWIKYIKGGGFRRWYGNLDFLLHYNFSASYLLSQKNATALPLDFLHKPKGTWTDLTSGKFSARIAPNDSFHDISGHCFYPSETDLNWLLAYANSKPFESFISVINSSFHFQVGDVGKIPILSFDSISTSLNAGKLIEISKKNWDSYETSWDFTSTPLWHPVGRHPTIKLSYQKLRAHWTEMTLEMQRLEEENNRIFINAYGLQDELTPEVPLNEITLTCNPHYRYGSGKTEEELEALLLTDTLREFVSYAVGCMFGRYALDKLGLVLANQGETIDDYRRLVPNSRFEADADNVIPMLDGEWFADDVTERFREFLRVTFGDAHYDENLVFIEQALNPKGKRNFTLRDYMLGEFYTDHVKRYKKRPIYWLFSSPKGTFNALIYLHRYRPDTASVVLRYLREFRAKLAARQSTLEQVLINPATSQGEKTKAVKEIDSLKKQIIELQDYENDTLYPLATANVALDLDDGVKVNYLKLGAALKKITGLDAKEED
jgi:hypothetical protein